MDIDDQFFKDDTPEENPNTPKDFLAMFNSSVLDQTKHYPDPIPVINLIQNENKYSLLTLMSYSLWQGKSKSKKTTVLAMAIAAYISLNRSTDAIRFEGEGEIGKVLFIDNEQGQSYGARTMRLILKLACLEKSENLMYADFREHTPQERVSMLHAALENNKEIKIVVIDGVVDFMEDFMDAKEGHTVVTDIIRLCSKYNVHIAGVLHQNKADKNARAHVGTISGQKCEMEIACEIDLKDKSLTIVECRASRGLPFEPFAIRWDKGELPYIVQDYKPVLPENNPGATGATSKKKKFGVDSLTLTEHSTIVQEIFKTHSDYNDGKLKDQIKDVLKSKGEISDGLARKFVTYWENQKLIVWRKGAKNAIIYSVPVTAAAGL